MTNDGFSVVGRQWSMTNSWMTMNVGGKNRRASRARRHHCQIWVRGYPDATQLDLTGMLELCINSPSVRLYPRAPSPISDDALAAIAMTPGADSPSTLSICLLRGPLEDFVRYSGYEASKWLIDLAHDICDPADRRGSLLVRKERGRLRQQWFPVATTDPLTASIYRYDLPGGITVGLSKISRRVRKSVIDATGNASTMANRVKGAMESGGRRRQHVH